MEIKVSERSCQKCQQTERKVKEAGAQTGVEA